MSPKTTSKKVCDKKCDLNATHHWGSAMIIGILIVAIVAIAAAAGPIIYRKALAYTNQGQEFKFSLDASTANGYRWSHVIDGENSIDVGYVYDDSQCTGDSETCAGKMTYTVTAKEPGNARIALKYCYIEDEGTSPCTYATYDIRVDEDRNIHEFHHGSYFD